MNKIKISLYILIIIIIFFKSILIDLIPLGRGQNLGIQQSIIIIK